MEKPNLNYINELSGDNLEFKTKVINVVKAELPIEIAIYYQDLDKNDFFQAAQSVHKLKHKISILGLEKSYYLAQEYEENLKNDSTALKADFETILKLMQEFVDHL